MNRPSQGLRPLLGSHADALDHAWLTGNERERRELEVASELMRRQAGSGVLLDPPSGNQASAAVHLGRIRHGKRQLGTYGLSYHALNRHVGVFGSSGSGKSNLVLHMLRQLIEHQIHWVLFDYKRSARALASLELPTPVHILTTARGLASSLRFNLLSPPPGVPSDDHDRQLAELVSSTWTGGDATITVLIDALRRARKNLDPLTPTLREVRDECRAMSSTGRQKGWLQTALRILDDLCDGPLGRVLASTRNADHLGLLLKHHTVIELDGLSASDGAFLASCVVRHLTQSMMHDRSRENLRFVAVIEEAHRLLRERGRESVLEQSLREARELGMGLIVVDQTSSQMSHTALANLHSVVAMRLGQQSDVQTAARSLLLREDQKRILHELGVGQAVVRSGHWHSAVQIDVPELRLDKGSVSDRDIEGMFVTSPFASSTVSARSAHGTPPRPPRGDVPGVPRGERAERGKRAPLGRATTDPLSGHPDAELLLKDVLVHPLSPVTDRYRRRGLSRRRGNGAKRLLVATGYIKPIELRTPEGACLLLDTTSLSHSWARRRGIERPPISGSLVHEYWCDRVARTLASTGWSVEREAPALGGRIDVLAIRAGERLAVEVETGKSSWSANLDRLAAAEVNHRAVLWLNPATIDKARSIASETIRVETPAGLLAWINSINGGENHDTTNTRNHRDRAAD
ncbi:MAG: DUF87 domain-containing protein [Planctomycetota bacterium]